MSVKITALMGAEGQVTGYDVVADTDAELAAYANILEVALRYMVPSGTTATRSASMHQVTAQLSMQLSAILHNNPRLASYNTRETLRGIRFYLLYQQRETAEQRGVSSQEAARLMMPDYYTYFELVGDNLTGGPVEL